MGAALQQVRQVRQVQLALLMAEAAVTFVIVGGTARMLHGSRRVPADLDVVVTHEDAAHLTAVLRALTSTSRATRPAQANPWRVVTSWSLMDVFVEDELPAWHMIEVDGTGLRVADE